MISINECKNLLPASDGMADEKIAEIRDYFYDLGGIMFDSWQAVNASSPKTRLVNADIVATSYNQTHGNAD